MNTKKIILLVLGISIITSLVTTLALQNIANNKQKEKTQEELISAFYKIETASLVSPHDIRKFIMNGQTKDFVLVDLRSNEEYKEGHIIGAINIPAYKDKDNDAYDQVERIVSSFQQLDKNKDIIVYCYSMSCMTGKKIGKILVDHNIYVKQLAIGWNEWRYYWDLWNHEHELKNTNVLNYIYIGEEPGEFAN